MRKLKAFQIEVVNWDKHQAKSDKVRSPNWFKLSNQFFLDHKIMQLNNTEKILFLYILSTASINNSRLFILVVSSAKQILHLQDTHLIKSLYSLQAQGLVNIDDCTQKTDSLLSVRREEITKEIEETEETPTPARPDGPSDSSSVSQSSFLVRFWESNRGSLPKAGAVGEKQVRAWNRLLAENPDLEYWKSVLKKMNQLPFCLGHTKGRFKANLTFFLKPDTHKKVMSGEYDPFNAKPNEDNYVDFF